MLNSLMNTIGNTPLIEIDGKKWGFSCKMFAKLEYFNPMGSVKDRIAYAMIEAAEKNGTLTPGSTIVEATSGNTGAGIAMVAAQKGYKCILVIQDKVSTEKQNLLKSLGAQVIVVPSSIPRRAVGGVYYEASRIAKETNGVMLDQYANPANSAAHYKSTGPEIFSQTNGKIDYFIAGMGTCGTICGTARYLKEKLKDIQIIGVEPNGSVYVGEKYAPYLVEGIGLDFIPGQLNYNLIDEIIHTTDAQAFHSARQLASRDGIFVGGSSGAAFYGALSFAQKMPANKTIVVLFPDSGYRYLSKFYDDLWLKSKGISTDFTHDAPLLQQPVISVTVNKIQKKCECE